MQFCAGRVPSLQHIRVGRGDGVSPKATTFGTKSSGVSFSSTPSQTAKLGAHTNTHTETHAHTKSSFPRTGTDQERGYYPTSISQTITKVKDWSVNQINKVGDWNVVGEAEDAGNRDAQPYHLPCPREGHTSWGEGKRGWRRGVSNH